MAVTPNVQYTLIASGATVSENFILRGATQIGVSLPALNASILTLQVSWDITSANFKNAFKSDLSSYWQFPTTSGNVAASIIDAGYGFPYGRFNFSVAQTDNRTLSIITK